MEDRALNQKERIKYLWLRNPQTSVTIPSDQASQHDRHGQKAATVVRRKWFLKGECQKGSTGVCSLTSCPYVCHSEHATHSLACHAIITSRWPHC